MRPSLHRLSAVGGLLLFLVPKLHLGTHLSSKLRFAAGLLFFALFSAALLGAQYLHPHGATIIVTSTNDSGPGSLRQALVDAHDGDTIDFDPALNGQTISLTSGELVIDKSITISGPGPNQLAVSGSLNGFRIFHVLPSRTVSIEGLTIKEGNGNGGGIYNDHATLSVYNCIIRSSRSLDGYGGGILNNGQGGSATLTIHDTTVINNHAGLGGGIYNDSTGSGNATLSLDNCSVDTNDASYFDNQFHWILGDGGGIYNLGGNVTITKSSVNNNSASYYGSPGGLGGGIANRGTLTITDSTISANQCPFGGGIGNQGSLTITNSTVSNNVANCLHDGPMGDGGGIYGNATITNSTITGNSATRRCGGFYGSGIIKHSTISANVGNQEGAGLLASGSLQIGNTILNANGISSSGGAVTSLGYNLSSDNGGGFLTGPGDQINTDPLLGPLQDNGGPTATHALLPGSPAINTGNPNFTPPPEHDQRGFGYVRVHNGRIDIGSFEAQPVGTISPTPTATATATIPPPGPATHFTLVAPAGIAQGLPFNFTVTARDQFGKVAIGYTGTVHFTSSDTGNGTHLPIDSTLTNGTGTFSAILQTPGIQTITATDTLTASVTGTSAIEVFEKHGSPTPTATATPTTPPGCPITQSTSQAITSSFTTCRCGNTCGFAGVETSYWRAFNMETLAGGVDYHVTGVSFGMYRVNVTNYPVTVRLYKKTGAPFPGGTRTVIGTGSTTVTSAQNETVISVPLTATVPAGTSELVMEVFAPQMQATVFYIGTNRAPETGLSYWSSNCNTCPMPRDEHFVFNVYGDCTGVTPSPTPTITPSPPPAATPCSVIFAEGFDNVAPPALPPYWVTEGFCAPPFWITSTATPDAGPNHAYIDGTGAGGLSGVIDKRLDTPAMIIPAPGALLTFRNLYVLSSGSGGAVLEVSSPNINGGTFTDLTDAAVGGSFVTGGYNGTITTSWYYPLSGRMAWTGTSGIYITTVANLGPNVAGQAVTLRFRMGSGVSPLEVWRIDSIFVQAGPGPCSIPSPTPTASATPTITATPSCPPVITQSTSQAITTTHGPCRYGPTGGFAQAENHYWRAFNMSTFVGGAEYSVSSVSFGVHDVSYLDSPPAVTVRLYTNTGAPFPGGTRTLIGSSTITVTSGGIVVTPLVATVPAGTPELVMELFTPDGLANRYVLNEGTNEEPETGPSYWSCTTEPPQVITSHLVFNIYGSCTGPTPTPTPSPTPARLLNLSTRMFVQTDALVGIGGFIISGSAPKQVLVRAIGPSLSQFGVLNALADPVLELHGPAGFTTITNDNWRDIDGGGSILATGLAPTNDLESAILATLVPGNYTAIVKGKDNTSGVGLVEAYDLGLATSQLANISTRAFVGTADNVMIAGFILGGGSNTQIVIRGLGPSLSSFGISNALADPTLELRDSNGALLASNDNWGEGIPPGPPIPPGSGLPPTNDMEAMLFVTLGPGTYTAILAGKNGGVGVGLVEIYNLQ